MSPAAPQSRSADEPDPGEVVTEALLRAAGNLGVKQATLAQIIGLSPASVSRMPRRPLPVESKAGELALMFLRVYRSLYTLFGGNLEQCRLWFHSENKHLCNRPVDMVQSIQGINRVADYLDALRGHS